MYILLVEDCFLHRTGPLNFTFGLPTELSHATRVHFATLCPLLITSTRNLLSRHAHGHQNRTSNRRGGAAHRLGTPVMRYFFFIWDNVKC